MRVTDTVEQLFLVRHAESEGNVAVGEDGQLGQGPDYARRVRDRAHWLWRLSQAGEVQARMAGAWLRDELAATLDGHGTLVTATSPHLRAMETAALLAIPKAAWEVEPDLREREWGGWDDLEPERQCSELARQRDHPFDWHPPGGESMSALIRRVREPLRRLLDAPASAAVVVSHADTIWALRYVMADLSPITWTATYQASRGTLVATGGILHFSRRNPETGELSTHFDWYREHCPWRQAKAASLAAVPTPSPFTAEQLLAQVNRVERLSTRPPATPQAP